MWRSVLLIVSVLLSRKLMWHSVIQILECPTNIKLAWRWVNLCCFGIIWFWNEFATKLSTKFPYHAAPRLFLSLFQMNDGFTMAAVDFSAADFFTLGFEARGFVRYQNLNQRTQDEKFRSLFGTSPAVIAAIWSDLRTATDPTISIDKHCRPIYILLMFRWLKSYESEHELHTDFNISVNTINKWCEVLTDKVARLRTVMVRISTNVGQSF